MKNKFFAVFGCCLLILACFSSAAAVSAQNSANTVDEAQTLIDGIVAYKKAESGVESIQEWIDTGLTRNAGATSEWYIMALSQTGKRYDYTAYIDALHAYTAENAFTNATNLQKYALAFIASGRADDGFVAKAIDETIGKQGIMSWIYGLHLLNNGCKSAVYTKQAVVEQILTLRLSDGGWALYGENSDIDVTASAIQALAPYYAEDESVKAAVNESLVYLGTKQLDDGGYQSFGTGNPESAAQVIIALSALGIDCTADARFIKDGNTLIDGMLKYRLADGSFSHVLGGNSNHSATVQVFYALVSIQRQQKGLGPLWVFDSPATAQTDETPVPAGEKDYKFWVTVSVAGLGFVACLVLIFTKKTHIKNFSAVLLVAAAVIAFVQLTNFSAAGDYYHGRDQEKNNVIGQVTLTIRCDTVAGKSGSEFIPADGVILDTSSFDIADGDTVYDILVEAARKFNIQIENNGTNDIVYIAGINYLYEYQFGDLSGWIFHVNGAAASVGCGDFMLSDGDAIEWFYTLSLGNDLI